MDRQRGVGERQRGGRERGRDGWRERAKARECGGDIEKVCL